MDNAMGNQQEVNKPDAIELAWLGGLLNGDGCFSLTFRTRNKILKCDMSLTLTQCDPCVIERATDILNRLDTNPSISEYASSGAGMRTKWNLRLSKMATIHRVIEAVLPFMVGEKQAQAKLMNRYLERRLFCVDQSVRRHNEIASDIESLKIAKEFYEVRRLVVPKEIVQVLNDYPAREYGQAVGSAQHA